jgi:hypothetical protein
VNAITPAEITVSDLEEFLTPSGLTMKAGCTASELPTLAIKELVDNAFDFDGATYHLDEETDEHVITDEGPGLSKDDILRLFDIGREMKSTKRWRRAGRGALGNGLRVACATIRLLRVSLTIASKEGTFSVSFDEIGRNSAELIGPPRDTGTEIRVGIDKRFSVKQEVIENSTLVAGAIHEGPANAWAFGMIDFRQLARQCDRMSEKNFATQFGADIGRDIPLAEITDEGIKKLHGQLRHRNPKNTILPKMGEDVFPDYYYDTAEGMVDIGRGGLVPATVEVWSWANRRAGTNDTNITGLWMNRTWSFTRPQGAYSDGNVILRGCGLDLPCKAPRAYYEIRLAITTSYFPMTSAGKAPDLSPFAELIKKAVRKATKEAYECADAPEKKPKEERPEKPEKITIREAGFSVMDDAVKHASDGFKNVITARQVFYSARSLVKEKYPSVEELQDSYFGGTLMPDYRKEYDTEHWPIINYDARGSASEPHDGRKNIQLSTVGVSNLTKTLPDLEKISAVLFIEKEQFSDIIGPVQDEFDLLLVEAKGQPTSAERETLQWAARAGLPVFIFSDCDIAGFQISEAIRNGTPRFPFPLTDAKRIGLDLQDAEELNLMPEPCTPNHKQLTWLENSDTDSEMQSFLENDRFELNHLSTNQMRELLRRKLTEAGVNKAMPSPARLAEELQNQARYTITEELMAEVEENITRMREDAQERIIERVNVFVQAVCLHTDMEELHEKTAEILNGSEFRKSPWRDAFEEAIENLEIISKPLAEKLTA